MLSPSLVIWINEITSETIATKIKEKILAEQKAIIAETDKVKQKEAAEKIGERAIKAIKGGIKSREWVFFMSQYADTPEQLMRLCGEDTKFNAQSWSDECLTYIASNTMCTITSRQSPIETITNQGTMNFMEANMIEGLDANFA